MSTDQPNPNPPRILEINEIPTEQTTTKEIDELNNVAGLGAEVVKDLCRRIIHVVQEVDRHNDVSRYVSMISLVATGPGGFELQLALRDATIKPEEIVAEVSAELASHANYHRPLRTIEIKNEHRSTTRLGNPNPSGSEGAT